MSFRAQILDSREQPTYLVQGSSNTGATWHYLQLDPIKKTAFLQALRESHFDCANFGTVLASGRGEMPPTHVRWEMEKAADN